ncbi:MAG: sigma-70 family RNA polymerase sigma factor [Candidatus Hydrogenedentota bacterium]
MRKKIKKTKRISYGKIDEFLATKTDSEVQEFIEEVAETTPKTEEPEEDIKTESIVVDDTLKLFLNEISKVKLLSFEEEIRLARKIRNVKIKLQKIEKKIKIKISNLKARKISFRKRKTLQSATRKNIKEQKNILETQYEEARRRLIEANLRLVVSIAKKYQNRGLPLLDLINEGNLGLLKAVDLFDHRKNYRFSTYATYWIRQSIVRALADQGRTIRLPVHLVDQLNRFSKTKQELTQKLRREPTHDELSSELEVPSEKIILWSNIMQDSASLDSPIYDSPHIQLADFIADHTSISPYSIVESDMVKKFVHERLLKVLKGKEKEIIKMRYGFDGKEPMTLEKIGNVLRITRERVRQLEKQALRRMRFYRTKKELKLYLQE